MANTAEEILLTIGARNNASNVASQIDRDYKNMASSISSALSSINQGMMNVGQVSDNVMQSLTGKSALDNVLGTSSKAETNKVLLKNMSDTEKGAEKLYDTVDSVTDKSLTSMQELIPSMKAFKSATGASDKEMINITDEMANFGAAVLAQTGSTDQAQQSMMDLSKGIKGAFASLDQYGITQASLERTGYWNGDESDVEGFMKAVQKVTGSTEELMETNQGLDALIGKAFSRAGKKIGNEFLPVIKDIKRGFLDLDDSLGGNLTASILAVSSGVEVMNQGLWNVSTTVNGIRDLADGFKFLKDNIRGAAEAAETASDAINTVSNVSDIGAGAGGAVGAGADIASKSSKTEKAVDAGANGLMFADLLKDNKDARKDAEKLLKELDLTKDVTDNVFDRSKEIYDPKRWSSAANFEKMKDAGHSVGAGGREGILNIIDAISDTKQSSNIAIDELNELNKVRDSLQDNLDDIQTPKSNFQKIGGWFKNLFSGADDALDAVDDVGDIGKTVNGAEDIAEGMSGLAGVGSTMAAAGPEMEAAAAGGAAVEAGATGLAATFTGLMVPLLAVSAAIMIMIPIVSLIAAEAMIFIKLLAEFMESLNFDSVNLDGAIKGISQIATALGWVGVAMGAMSFTSIMTGLAVMTGGFLGITGPLQIAKDALMKAAQLLSSFNTVSIDPGIADTLKTIGDSLMSVSSAMGALTWTNITTGISNWIAGALGFSSVTAGLEQAKNDIIEASKKLQEFSTITPLDEGVANNIQNVCNSLASVGDAMGALKSIRDGQNWDNIFGGLMAGLFGEGVNIQTALNNVKQDIIDASVALSGFTGLDKIPEDVASSIQSVGSTLSAVSDTVNQIKEVVGSGFDNWVEGIFGGYDVVGGLNKIKTDIINAHTALSGFSGLTPLDPAIAETIKSVSTTIQAVSDASNSLIALPPMDGFDPSVISTAVSNVRTAITQLQSLSGTTLGEDVNTLLSTVQTALETLKATLAAAAGFTAPAVNIGTQIVAGVQSGLAPLASTVSSSISSATSSATGPAWSGGSSIASAINDGFSSTLNLHTTMETEMGHVKTAIDNGISAAKSAAQSGAAEITAAFQAGLNVGSPGDIARTMKQEMLYTKAFIVGAGSYLKKASFDLASSIVSSFGTPSLGVESIFADNFDLNSLNIPVSNVPQTTNNRTVIIQVNEGAIHVDARNKTEKEAVGLMTLALEHIDDIDVSGG